MISSPLRYPGGKAKIAPHIHDIIKNLSPAVNTYYEPFCGGAGVALYLLLNDFVEFVSINDFDRAIYSFWRAAIFETDKLVSMIEKSPISIDEWRKQKAIYLSSTRYSVDYAFATLFLNRTNRSGIISAGPIGGYKQEGTWKIEARYNKNEIINRIRAVSKHRKNIKLNNMEARRYIRTRNFDHASFIFFDPPYVNNAKRLYKNSLSAKDHTEMSLAIKNIRDANWIVTYDDIDLIRNLYKDCRIDNIPVQYSAASKKKANELLIRPI